MTESRLERALEKTSPVVHRRVIRAALAAAEDAEREIEESIERQRKMDDSPWADGRTDKDVSTPTFNNLLAWHEGAQELVQELKALSEAAAARD